MVKVKAGDLITSDLLNKKADDMENLQQKTVKFDKNGKVGIGTTDPRGKLHIKSVINSIVPPLIVGNVRQGVIYDALDSPEVEKGTIAIGHVKMGMSGASYLKFTWKGFDGILYYGLIEGHNRSKDEEP